MRSKAIATRIVIGRVLFAFGVVAVVAWLIYGAFAAFHPSWLQVALVATEWHDEKGTLAKYLSDDQWDKVATFYLNVEQTDAALANRNCRKHRSLGEAVIGFDHGHDALVSLGARGVLPSRVSKQVL